MPKAGFKRELVIRLEVLQLLERTVFAFSTAQNKGQYEKIQQAKKTTEAFDSYL
jgi:hypothetical protein